MFRRNFFGAGPWDRPRGLPTVRLAGARPPQKQMGQMSGLACCNAPNGQGYCFDQGSGECIATWVSASGAPPGSPACVENAQGQVTHPSCVGLEPGPPTTRPELPPGCVYVAAESNAMQDVICECYNCTTRQSDGWRGPLGELVAAGLQNPCLRSPEWFPKPAQCPSGPGGGGTYTPPTAPVSAVPPPPSPPAAPAPAPVPAPTPEPSDYYPVEEQCPVGQFWNGESCETLPVGAAPAPAPIPASPVTQVSPGASVPIVPGPFQRPPAAPAVPFSARGGPVTGPAPIPQRQFAPSTRPSCPATSYKTKMFPGTTRPTRPDAFTEKQRWTS